VEKIVAEMSLFVEPLEDLNNLEEGHDLKSLQAEVDLANELAIALGVEEVIDLEIDVEFVHFVIDYTDLGVMLHIVFAINLQEFEHTSTML
jgi:hypothetical protein